MEPRVTEIDFTDLDRFADGFPHDLFDLHRRQAPIFWHEPTENTPDGEGFWSVATHELVLQVLRDPATYSSVTGGDRPYGGTVLQDLPVAGKVLNMMDDPRHAKVRRLVSAGLTPRMIRRVEDDLRARAAALLDAIDDGAEVDVVAEVAVELPMQMICLLLGVPESERHWLFDAIEPGFDFRGRRKAFESGRDESLTARMYAFGNELIRSKREQPADDMLSVVANATLDDPDAPRLSDEELYMFFSLLFSAGAETTRNAIAGGLMALVEHPDQLAALRRDPALMDTAVDEIVRWTTPSPSKRRTATRDVLLGGKQITAGQKVLIWEGSANRDPAVFTDPDRFDIARNPNPHLGFGNGSHYCLGANLARLELRVCLAEILARFGTIELTGPPEWTRSNRHTGIRSLKVRFGRSTASTHP